MVNSNFSALCSKAWTLQILVYLIQNDDARVSPIAHTLGAGRTAIAASVQHLIGLGYLRRNSGHGHPLRPAYVLTAKGRLIAQWATQLDEVLMADDWKIARRTWTLPVLRLATPSRRFGEFRAELQPMTDRALSETLKLLGKHHWLQRDVNADSKPPSVSYSPCGMGEILVPCLEQSFRL